MNKVVHSCTSILLSTLILFTGSGLIVGKMVCLKSGYELISLEQAKDCCDDNSNKSKIDSRCCDISNFVFHPNIFISENKLSIKTITPIHFDFFSNFFQDPISYWETINNKTPLPDPLSSSRPSIDQSFFCIFRI